MTFVSVIILKHKRLCCVVLLMLVISYLLAAERKRLARSQWLAHKHMKEFIHLIVESFHIFFFLSENFLLATHVDCLACIQVSRLAPAAAFKMI